MSRPGAADNSVSCSPIRVWASVILAVLLLVLDQTWPESLRFVGISLSAELTGTFGTVVATAVWIVLGYEVDGLLTVFVWNSRARRRSGVPVPKLLTQLAGLAIWITTAIILLAVVYDVPVAGFLTTSGIIIAVIGFALRNLIADVFTGIALGIERPLQIGDWIQFDEGPLGKVVEINWRAARLITMDEVSVMVPNSQLATAAFRNYSQPNEYWRDDFEIVLPYDVTYRQAERILLSAVAIPWRHTGIFRSGAWRPGRRAKSKRLFQLTYLMRGARLEYRASVQHAPKVSSDFLPTEAD